MYAWLKTEFGQLSVASLLCMLAFIFLYLGVTASSRPALILGSICLLGSMILPLISAFWRQSGS